MKPPAPSPAGRRRSRLLVIVLIVVVLALSIFAALAIQRGLADEALQEELRELRERGL